MKEQEQSGNMANNMEELKELGKEMEQVSEQAEEAREGETERFPGGGASRRRRTRESGTDQDGCTVLYLH